MPTYKVAVDKVYTYFLNVEADSADEAENLINDLLIADTFDNYLSDHEPLEVTDDGFGNPTVIEE
jgi:hypothetical protein